MKDFLKNISSLLVAGALLLGILFLPADTFERVMGLLNFLSKSDSAAIAFGNYLLNKIVTGGVILTITVLLSIAAKRAIESHLEEREEIN